MPPPSPSSSSAAAPPIEELFPNAKPVAADEPNYKVRQGDCCESIAVEHGLFWETLWNDPKNARVKDKRKDPNCLLPGDRLHVKKVEPKQEDGAAEVKHRFKRKGVPSKLVMVFNDRGEPRAGEAYKVLIDGKVYEGTTDGDGRVEVKLPPNARKGVLYLGEDQEEFAVRLRGLDPVDTPSGAQQRLTNLGLDPGPVDGRWGPQSAAALAMFQTLFKLEATGRPDPKTLDQLKSVHGC